MNVYISGPMTGKPFYNFEEFDKAANIIKELGHEPINPAHLSRLMVAYAGFDPNKEESYKFYSSEDYMEHDIVALRGADALVLLPGWSASSGAQVEIAYARYRKIPVYGSVQEFEYAEFARRTAAEKQAA